MKKAIWMITGGPMQVIAAKKIREKGYFLIVSDRNPKAACAPLADLFLAIDTFDVNAHLAVCDAIHKKHDIKAVMTFGADCHYTVANVAAHLGLPHINPAISSTCRDKTKTRQLLQSAGLYQPASYSVKSYEEALLIFEKNPETAFVIKATDNSGSRGFQVIKNKNTFTREKFQYTLGYGTTGYVILEEQLQADPHQISEASVETIWFEGKMYWVNWVDRIFPRDLIFFPSLSISYPTNEGIEIAHINPAKHDYSIKRAVAEMIERAGHALGIHKEKKGHLLKADIFFSTKGPVILELTPRSSGGWDSSGSSPTRGANIAEGIIELALGSPLTLDLWYRCFHYHDAERTAVVLSKIPDHAIDCTGRQFTLTSGYHSTTELLKKAINQLEKEEYVSV